MTYQIFLFDSLGSTNDVLKGLACEGAPEGTVVIARRQTAGRGRLGRRWDSPRGGAWFSLLLRPPIPVEQAGCISILIAVSLARALRGHWGVPVGVKWPNDLYVPHPHPHLSLALSGNGEGTDNGEGGPQAGVRYQKLGGILIELSTSAARIEWLIAGIGINVNNEPPARATSLARELGHTIPLEDFFSIALEAIACDYARFLAEGFGFIYHQWQELSVLPKSIEVVTGTKSFSAEVLGLAPSGRLVVRTGESIRELAAEEVTLCPP